MYHTPRLVVSDSCLDVARLIQHPRQSSRTCSLGTKCLRCSVRSQIRWVEQSWRHCEALENVSLYISRNPCPGVIDDDHVGRYLIKPATRHHRSGKLQGRSAFITLSSHVLSAER